jgi:UDP-glucose 4-epimerase
MGFDARLQFVHEDDLVRAMVRSTTGDQEGIVNIAGDGVITLAQAVALLDRPSVPVIGQAAGMLGSVFKRFGLADFSADQMSLLSFGRGVDTTRMRDVFGFEPEYSTRETFESFAAAVRESGPQLAGRSA